MINWPNNHKNALGGSGQNPSFESEMKGIASMLMNGYSFRKVDTREILYPDTLAKLDISLFSEYQTDILLNSTFNKGFCFRKDKGVDSLVTSMLEFLNERARDSVQHTELPRVQAQMNHSDRTRADGCGNVVNGGVTVRSLYQLAYLILELRFLIDELTSDDSNAVLKKAERTESATSDGVVIDSTFTLRFMLCDLHFFETVIKVLSMRDRKQIYKLSYEDVNCGRGYVLSSVVTIRSAEDVTPIVDCHVRASMIEIPARELQWVCLAVYSIITLFSAITQAYAEVADIRWLKGVSNPVTGIVLLLITSYFKINIDGWTFENMLRGVLSCDRLSNLPAWQKRSILSFLRPRYTKAQWINCVYDSVSRGLMCVGGMASCWAPCSLRPPAFDLDEAVQLRDLIRAGYTTHSRAEWDHSANKFSIYVSHKLINPRKDANNFTLSSNGHYHCESWDGTIEYWHGRTYEGETAATGVQTVDLPLTALVGMDETFSKYKKSKKPHTL